MEDEWNLSEEEWQERLSPDKFEILRGCGTEAPFSGKYADWKEKGTFVCGACGFPLFRSNAKYDSKSGWPSFWEALDPDHVQVREDHKLGYARVEVLCGRCGSHLGHVFPDGPSPTGERYCINSLALDFVENEE